MLISFGRIPLCKTRRTHKNLLQKFPFPQSLLVSHSSRLSYSCTQITMFLEVNEGKYSSLPIFSVSSQTNSANSILYSTLKKQNCLLQHIYFFNSFSFLLEVVTMWPWETRVSTLHSSVTHSAVLGCLSQSCQRLCSSQK